MAKEEAVADPRPVPFIWGGNTGLTYEELKRRRAIATALASRNKGFPKNVGEGLTYLGESIGEAVQGWQTSAAEREMAARDAGVMGGAPTGGGAGTPFQQGGTGYTEDPAASQTPPIPIVTEVKARPVTAAEAEVANQPAQTGPAPVGAPVPDAISFDPRPSNQQKVPLQAPVYMPPGSAAPKPMGQGGVGHANAAPAGVQVASAATGTMSDALPPEATQVAALTPPNAPVPGVFDAPAKLPANAPRSFVPTGEPTREEATANRIVGGQDMTGVDPRLMDIMRAAARGLPPGYTVQPTSGVREGGGGYHPKGVASDWQIIDPQGRAIPNRGPDSTGLYTQLAQSAYSYQNTKHPNLTGAFNWGGAFGTSKANPNEPDLMHFDLGGDRGRIGQYRRSEIYGPPDGGAPVRGFAMANADGAPAARGGGYSDPRGLIPYIREGAIARGMDPDVAVRVAAAEGLNTFQSSVVKNGRREPSWGAFQLYTGGGLGNKFQQATGLDPSDPKNERATIDFALDQAKQGGWGPWYGAKGAGIGQWQGIDGKRSSLEDPRDGVAAALMAQQQPDLLADVAGSRPRGASYAPTAGLGGSGGVMSDAPPVTGMGSAVEAGVRGTTRAPQVAPVEPVEPVVPPVQTVQARSSVVNDAGPIKAIPGSVAPVIGAMPPGATVQPPAATGNRAIGKMPSQEDIEQGAERPFPKLPPQAITPPKRLPDRAEQYWEAQSKNPYVSDRVREHAKEQVKRLEAERNRLTTQDQEAFRDQRELRQAAEVAKRTYELGTEQRKQDAQLKRLQAERAQAENRNLPDQAYKLSLEIGKLEDDRAKNAHEREKLWPLQVRREQAQTQQAEQTAQAGQAPKTEKFGDMVFQWDQPTGTWKNVTPGEVSGADKPMTERQMTTLRHWQTSVVASSQLGDGRALAGPWDKLKGKFGDAGNYFVSSEYQKAKGAADAWIEANLRTDSGAAIAHSEYDDKRRTYFPRPGDSEEEIRRKTIRREATERGNYESLGHAKSYADRFKKEHDVRVENERVRTNMDSAPDGSTRSRPGAEPGTIQRQIKVKGVWQDIPQ